MAKSSIRDNSSRGSVGEFLTANIHPDAELSIVSAYFTIYAYHKLKDKLDSIKELNFLFGEPTFLKSIDPTKTNKKDFKIEDDKLIIPIESRLSQKAVAKECSDWIKEKVNIKSMVKPNFLHGKMYHIKNTNLTESAIVGSSNFTVQGLGLNSNANIELNLVMNDDRDREDLKEWFNELWSDKPDVVEDVKLQVLKYLEMLYIENEPEFVYFKTLYHIFENYLSDQRKGGLLTEKTGFFESEIWNMLYTFQKDGVKGAINKILKHGGCIIADSVGLGKTFEALAVIRYFELLNQRVLVLCPKKLRENWTIYQTHKNNSLNPFLKDRYSYTVMYHTDLNRTNGIAEADCIDLANFNWGAYDLVVIDESHNFRNNSKSRETDEGEKIISRYDRLLEDIIKKGVKTKVLLLSATPVNNNLRDLRNQIYFITEGKDNALFELTGIKNIAQSLKLAQTQFTVWSDAKKTPNRSVKGLLEKLDSSFFKLLDELTIARSRKHVEKYYDLNEIGKFPERLPVYSVYPEIDTKKRFPSYDKLNKEIMKYKLSLFNPSAYLKEGFEDYYEQKAKKKVLAFSQATRESFLIGMMKVNFLKRLESSIESFEISMDRTIRRIEDLESKIKFYQQEHPSQLTLEFDDFVIPDDIDDDPANENEDWQVGKKLKFDLAHIDLESWLIDLANDRDQLIDLLNNAVAVTPERDAKLLDLKRIIEDKINNPLNKDNKKVLIFTAFADTAEYLYNTLKDWVFNDLKLNIALVSGGSKENTTTFMPKGFKGLSDFNAILTNFSPVSKKRNKMKNMPQEGCIDILIATDCISEGQNLQDCDFIINYDIHWNPVRIIQRFGRIDRIGSINKQIKLVNFWPTKDLDNYINLKERVEARMALVDVAATGEENLLNAEQIEELIEEDLKFRNKQLKTLQNEVLDLEDLDENISLSEFTLDDFRIELMNFLEKNKHRLEDAPLGLYAISPSPSGSFSEIADYTKLSSSEKDIIKPGVIYCLRQKGNTEGNEEVNPLQPYFLIYIRDDGTVRFNYVHAKQILDVFRLLCTGVSKPYEQLCDIFNTETEQGYKMDKYNELLIKAVEAIKIIFSKKAASKLTSDRGGVIIKKNQKVNNADQFELITWLIIK